MLSSAVQELYLNSLKQSETDKIKVSRFHLVLNCNYQQVGLFVKSCQSLSRCSAEIKLLLH